MARVNQQLVMHQLAFLSTRWVTFFHSMSNGVHCNPFLFTINHYIIIFGLFLVVFSIDLTSHIATLFTFLPSYVLYQPWYLTNYPLLT
jgi:hypothetical protein